MKSIIVLLTYVLLVYASDALQEESHVESFITEEAAKDLRHKLSAKGEQQDDYDDILKKIIQSVRKQQATSTGNELVYEKKYFDVMNDLDSEDFTDEDLTQEIEKTSHGDYQSAELSPIKRINSRRFRRDVTHGTRKRRQSNYQLIYVPLHHVSSSRPNVDFFFPADFDFIPIDTRNSFQYSVPNPYPYNILKATYGNNPWTRPGKLYPPGNTYLPAHNNVATPPHNHVEVEDEVTPFEHDVKIGIFDIDEPLPIFDVAELGPNDSRRVQRPNSIRDDPRPRTTTRRPMQRPSSQQRPADTFVNPDEYTLRPFKIEYAPEEDDDPDATTTTRAPLRRPSLKTNQRETKQSDNNITDQKKDREASKSKTVPPRKEIRTTTRQPQRKLPQNKSLPACVLAIVNCCSRYDTIVRLPCFEKYGCNGSFFDRSPCSKDIKEAAFLEVEKFSNLN